MGIERSGTGNLGLVMGRQTNNYDAFGQNPLGKEFSPRGGKGGDNADKSNNWRKGGGEKGDETSPGGKSNKSNNAKGGSPWGKGSKDASKEGAD